MNDNEKKISLVIADDHDLFREGLKVTFISEKDFVIVGEAEDSKQAIELVRYYKPSIILLDIIMPGMDGIEAARIIRKHNPGTFIVMLTSLKDYLSIDKALDTGADGYIVKDIKKRDLIEALYKVMNGERVFSKSVLNYLQNRFTDYTNIEHSPIGITKREQEILNLVAFGLSNLEIADKLFLSEKTVENHRSNIIHKLNIKNTSQLIRYAVIHQTY